MSAIEHVSVTQGCPLGGVPLYTLSTRITSQLAWLRVLNDPERSHYLPTTPFPFWINHQNLKSVLYYKNKIFEEDHTNPECEDFELEKFNKPKPKNHSIPCKLSCPSFVPSNGQFINQPILGYFHCCISCQNIFFGH